MDLDLFFSSQRWKILEIIATQPSSPLEISKKLKTSMAYISQQLKLLEAANLVAKEKTGAVEKGKPRRVFSISNEILYVTALAKNVPFKKSIPMTDYHKAVLNIWFLDNHLLHYPLAKFYLAIEKYLLDISGIYIDTSSKNVKLMIVSENKKIESFIRLYFQDSESKIDYRFISETSLKNFSKNLYAIYDPKFLLRDLDRLKGGEDKK